VPEILGAAVFPQVAAGYAAHAAGVLVTGTVAALAVLWYGAETALVRTAGWHAPLYRSHATIRDLLLTWAVDRCLGRYWVRLARPPDEHRGGR
jgi:hypothetical protein